MIMGRKSCYRSVRSAVLLIISAIIITACGETHLTDPQSTQLSPFTRKAPQVGRYKVGKPYRIAGRWYRPREYEKFSESGIASWYGPKFHGRRTANGEIFDMHYPSAAHKTLPLPSMILVTNLNNGRQVKLRVNDRGPFAHDRILDVSRRAADLLGFRAKGTTRVHIRWLDEESRRLKQIAMNGGGSSSSAIPTGGLVQSSSNDMLGNLWQDVKSAIDKAEPIYPAWNQKPSSSMPPSSRGLVDHQPGQTIAHDDSTSRKDIALSKAQEDLALLPPESSKIPSSITESELLQPQHAPIEGQVTQVIAGQTQKPLSRLDPVEYLRPNTINRHPPIDQTLPYKGIGASQPALSNPPEPQPDNRQLSLPHRPEPQMGMSQPAPARSDSPRPQLTDNKKQKYMWLDLPHWAWGLRGDKPPQGGR